MADTTARINEDSQTIQRFGLQFRFQHTILFSSVLLLIFTGIPLWGLSHPGSMWWSQTEGYWRGDLLDVIRLLHRIGGAVLIGLSIYHILYTIFSAEGRREFVALLPTPKDVVDVTQNSLYFLGLRKERPRFGRFSYYEKFDYWAVYWGCVIMIGTGLVLWFDKAAAEYISWFPYELAALVHADEAVLATLALFIWHFYNVHYNPSRFPGTMLWLHGRMSREEMMHDHPLEYEALMRGQTESSSDSTDASRKQ